MKNTPEDIKDILLKLQEANLDAVIVGGQAVNLWAYQYSERCHDLQSLQPYSSEDIDFFGSRVEAMICHEVLGGQVRINRDFDPSPNAGVILIEHHDQKLRIDILASVYGLNDSEIVSTARTFIGLERLAGISVKVLHPVLCLEGKLRCLRGLPQQGRQDLKHVQISTLVVREILKDICQDSDPRIGLKMLERVFGDISREDGLNAWYKHKVYLENAIPFENIDKLKSQKWHTFKNTRLPQIIKLIQEKRKKYINLMSRLGESQENTFLELFDPTLKVPNIRSPRP